MGNEKWRFIVAVWLGIWTGAAAAAPVLYVSPQGKDTWSGKLAAPNARRTDGPLATVPAAQAAVRRLRQGGATGRLEVCLRGGTYQLAAPLQFDPRDSDTSYVAYPGERPVLSGGVAVTGWRRVAGDLWEAPAPRRADGTVLVCNQLFVNGRRATLARTPNAVPTGPETPLGSTEGFFVVAGKAPPLRDPATGQETARDNNAFLFAPGSIKNWPHLSDVRVVLYHSWETSRTPIASVEEDKQIVNLAGRFNWPIGYFQTPQRYYVENAPDALDAPGEWYLDKTAEVIRYVARPGEDLRKLLVVAPRLHRLMDLRGEAAAGLWVENLTFRGLSFQYEDWVLEPTGHSDGQAVVTAPAAIMADGARGCVFEQCEIAHVGDYAIWLRNICKDNVIRQCRIHEVGTGGVRLGVAYCPQSDAVTSSGNVVDNCHIYDGNHVYAGGIGLWVGQAFGNRITHNEIHDFTYSGMSIGWNWGDEFNRCRENLIAHNHVHHVMNHTLNDGGCLYTLGNSPGSIIRGNVFHDAWPWSAMGWGIYLDATTNGYLVEDNLVYHTLWGGWMGANGNHENVLQNNIFALFGHYALWPYFHQKPNTFRRNIVYTTQGQLFWPHVQRTLKARREANEPLGEWNRNCYWDPRLAAAPAAGEDPFNLMFLDMTWDEWRQQTGLDRDSVLADPKFRDVGKLDFALAADSPALPLGFRPLHPEQAGLYGDPQWVAEGRAVKHPATVMPAPPAPPGPQLINDGFENTVVGAHPDRAHVSGETLGAAIVVTDEQAATGRHSLKVKDARGLTPDWQPHLFYQPWLSKGRARQSFDLRLMPGALLYTEWRDDGTYPDNIGPSVVFDTEGGGAVAQVRVGGRVLTTIPVGQWVHVELEGALGKTAPKTWTLRVQVEGQEAQTFTDLPPAGPKFTALQWLGFVSTATVDTAFYLDNVRVETVGP